MELGTVKEIAEWIIEINTPYYAEDLLKLIPEELLNKRLTDENLDETMRQVDAIRFKKEDELKSKIKTDEMTKILVGIIINYPNEILPKELEMKRREIKFIFNVAATIIHQ